MGSATPEPHDEDAAELAELRRRVSALEGPRRTRHWWKSLLAAVLIFVACVLTPLSVVAVWANSQVRDTNRYLATVAPLAQNPAVQTAVTDRATTAIMQYIPLDSLVTNLAPADRPLLNTLLGQVGSALTDGLTGFVRGQVQKVVESDTFSTLWVNVNRTAHASLDKALTGEGGAAVQLKGDSVTLDLAPLIAQVKTRLVDNGLSIASKIPEVHTDFVLVSSDNISKVRTYLRLLELAGTWLPVAAVLLAAGGVLLALRRRRALVTTALGMAAAAMVLGIGLTAFRAIYLDRLPAGVNQAAAAAVYDALVHYLRAGVRLVLVLGVLVALGAWLTGAGRRAGTVRSLWHAGFAAVRQTAQRLGLRLGPVGRFTHRFKAWLGWAALAVVVVIFLTWTYPTGLVVLWLAVALVLALAVLEFLDDPGDAADSGQPDGAIPAR